MNVKLLRKVQKHILAEPKRIEMSSFYGKIRGKGAPKCGTVGCIAGWAVMLVDGIPKENTSEDYARIQVRAPKLLDLSRSQEERLFFVHNWPVTFQAKYYVNDLTPKREAELTSRRIDHFIKTKGAE